ncbi:hypothetical protein [Epilithonimonas vandammei]|uniref:hypothetical protein n=1 Tax=Epilithonimonas vandammei TaxID=2487072 RepID=UPI0013DD9E32|nr:hypothetical protein [Epilithonimonas vandammei]
MSRLTLDQFKKKAEISKEKTKELEKLTGGLLGDCHVKPVDFDPGFGSGIPPIKSGQDR